MSIIGTRIRSYRFIFSKLSKEFIAEISDLNCFSLFSQVYDDAADTGFVMVSARTGKEVVFLLTKTQRDADGDIQFWLFEPTSREAALREVKVVLLND